jgi:hypothetical protein
MGLNSEPVEGDELPDSGPLPGGPTSVVVDLSSTFHNEYFAGPYIRRRLSGVDLSKFFVGATWTLYRLAGDEYLVFERIVKGLPKKQLRNRIVTMIHNEDSERGKRAFFQALVGLSQVYWEMGFDSQEDIDSEVWELFSTPPWKGKFLPYLERVAGACVDVARELEDVPAEYIAHGERSSLYPLP